MFPTPATGNNPACTNPVWDSCSEEERLRIEATNPNPRLPLVRYVGGTWRVGGILALSRAFGDAYLKGSLQFEGVRAGGDGYSSGFGVVSEPDTTLIDITGAPCSHSVIVILHIILALRQQYLQSLLSSDVMTLFHGRSNGYAVLLGL